MLGRSILGLTAVASSALASLPPITAKGAKFFTNGNQLYLKGIAYQITNDDPLANGAQCAMDAALMKTLGTNAIRVYHVDPTANHDACMNSFADAGIYAFIDLDTFSTYILPTTPTWTQAQYNAYANVMDAFQGYSNTGGFFVGNEVMDTGPGSIAAPYIKAAAADMKAYRDKKGYRPIPIGYSAADIPVLRPNLQNYLACGSNPADALDFYSLNAYEWCGDSTYDQSGYSNLNAMAQNYSIPIFFSETGCNTVEPRTFGDQAAILGPDMDNTWSGAIIYEWVQEGNNYGLINYNSGNGISGSPVPIQPQFDNLGNQWKTLNPTGVAEAAYTPSFAPPACPPYTATNWEVSGDVPLPTIGAKAAGSVPSLTQSAAGPTATSAGSSSGTSGATSPSQTGTSNAGSDAKSATPSTGAAARVASTQFNGNAVMFIGSAIASITLFVALM